eukprot:COSAG02_NODE_7763_length_2857_cov_10.222936_2_plen_876_part_01
MYTTSSNRRFEVDRVLLASTCWLRHAAVARAAAERGSAMRHASRLQRGCIGGVTRSSARARCCWQLAYAAAMPAVGLRIAALLCGVLARPAAGCTCPSSHPTCYGSGYCYDGDMDEPNYGCGSYFGSDCSGNSPPPPPPPTPCSSYSSCGTCVGQDEPGTFYGVNECDFCRSDGHCSHSLNWAYCSDIVYGPSGSCTACDAGKYWTGSRCSSCAVGRYSTGGEVTSCRYCTAGRYQSSTGASSCDDCGDYLYPRNDGGQYSSNGASSCIDCAVGQYTENIAASSCISCPNGQTTESTNSKRESDCAPPPPPPSPPCSSYSSCGTCVGQDEPGTFYGVNECDFCRNEGYCSHSLNWAYCSDIVYGPSGSCTACDAGKYWTGSRCSSCAVGRYSTGGEVTSCQECAAGQYADDTGETSCTNCHAGQFSTNSASARCFDCNAGKYQDIRGATSCKDCPSGRSSSAGSDESSDCVAGACSVYSGSSNCAQCVAHTSEVAFELENAWEALGNIVADIGFDAGQSDCDFCRTTGVCGPLQAGCDDEVPHGTSCDNCVAGKYNSGANDVACELCSAGQYQPTAGTQRACISCDPGQYQDDDGSTSRCKDCSAGKYQPDAGQDSCDDCQRGKYQPYRGQTECRDCPSDAPSSYSGSSDSSDCHGGGCDTFSGGGIDQCSSCVTHESDSRGDVEQMLATLSGSAARCDYCKDSNSCGMTMLWCEDTVHHGHDCSACPAGKRSTSSSSVSTCIECQAGTYSPDDDHRLEVCLPCPQGQTSRAGSSVCYAGSLSTRVMHCVISQVDFFGAVAAFGEVFETLASIATGEGMAELAEDGFDQDNFESIMELEFSLRNLCVGILDMFRDIVMDAAGDRCSPSDACKMIST